MIAIDVKHVKGKPGSSALFSGDELHRYMLERGLETAPQLALGVDPVPRRLVAVGMNPSIADAFINDPTVRRELSFGAAWDCSLYVKCNLYGWRATRPADMWAAHRSGKNIVGEMNDPAIRTALTMLKRDGGIALACWGTMHKDGDRDLQARRVLQMMRISTDLGITWMCLGVNKDGSPKHPLYLPSDTKIRPWTT